MFSRIAPRCLVGLLPCLLSLTGSFTYAQRPAVYIKNLGSVRPVRQQGVPTATPLLARKACNPAQITVAKKVLCTGETLDLRSNVLPSYTFRWLKDNAVLPGSTTPALTINSPGTYTLELTNTAIPGCVRLDSVTIRESTLSKATVSAVSGGTAICAGNTLITSTIDGGTYPLTYQWRLNYHDLPGNSPTLIATQAGLYTVSVFDADCSVDADVVDVLQTPAPIFPAPPPQCVGGSTAFPLHAEPKDGIFAGPGIQNNLFWAAVAGGGTHTLTYSVTNAAGCSGTTSQTIAVVDVPQPDLGPDQLIIVGSSVTLKGPVRPESRLTYVWEPLMAGLSGSLVTVQPPQTTTYRLTVSRDGLCALSSSVQVEVLPGLFIPTAFTPNGDGQNDTWELTGVDGFPTCRVRIYDRWGNLLLDESPYARPWDGRVRGERVPAGPYRFVVNPTPTLPERAGTLVLVE